VDPVIFTQLVEEANWVRNSQFLKLSPTRPLAALPNSVSTTITHLSSTRPFLTKAATSAP